MNDYTYFCCVKVLIDNRDYMVYYHTGNRNKKEDIEINGDN